MLLLEWMILSCIVCLAVLLGSSFLVLFCPYAAFVLLRSRVPKMTDNETTTAEMLLEALQPRASLNTQCADNTVISVRIDLLSTG